MHLYLLWFLVDLIFWFVFQYVHFLYYTILFFIASYWEEWQTIACRSNFASHLFLKIKVFFLFLFLFEIAWHAGPSRDTCRNHAHLFTHGLRLLSHYMKELSSFDRGCIGCQSWNIHHLALYRKSLPIPIDRVDFTFCDSWFWSGNTFYIYFLAVALKSLRSLFSKIYSYSILWPNSSVTSEPFSPEFSTSLKIIIVLWHFSSTVFLILACGYPNFFCNQYVDFRCIYQLIHPLLPMLASFLL